MLHNMLVVVAVEANLDRAVAAVGRVATAAQEGARSEQAAAAEGRRQGQEAKLLVVAVLGTPSTAAVVGLSVVAAALPTPWVVDMHHQKQQLERGQVLVVSQPMDCLLAAVLLGTLAGAPAAVLLLLPMDCWGQGWAEPGSGRLPLTAANCCETTAGHGLGSVLWCREVAAWWTHARLDHGTVLVVEGLEQLPSRTVLTYPPLVSKVVFAHHRNRKRAHDQTPLNPPFVLVRCSSSLTTCERSNLNITSKVARSGRPRTGEGGGS